MLVETNSSDFIWASGIEDTFVLHARSGQRSLDEYELMGHYDHWPEDLALTRQLGVRALRWGVPWYRVEPQRGRFNWSWTDQVIPYLVEDLGVTPIIDLIHYGCPSWLPRAFADPEYPELVAAYARAFANRYGNAIHWYTPLNEPHMTCLMCGRRGVWPPYLRGDRGYIRIMLQVVQGMIRTIESIREVDPEAVIVQVEACALHRAAHEDLEPLAMEERIRRFLSYDLLDGRVTSAHPVFPWLVRNGARPTELKEIADRRVQLDIMGLNFYPQWSTHQLYIKRGGRVGLRSTEQDGSGFAELIKQQYDRYGVPVMVTETSAYGPDEVRSRWLEASVGAVKSLRQRGVPVVGYTWFPLYTMVDWRYRYGRGPAEQYRIDLGLYTLSDGSPRWQPTPLAEQLAAYVRNSAEAVGSLRASARPPTTVS